MIRDLLTPENHRSAYVWAAVLLAHGLICQVLVVALMPSLGPWWSVAVVSAGYLCLWEAAQLWVALWRGDALRGAVADGIVDWVGVTGGAYAIAAAAAGDLRAAGAALAALLIVAAVGYSRRE